MEIEEVIMAIRSTMKITTLNKDYNYDHDDN